MFTELGSQLANFSDFNDLRLNRRYGLIVTQLGDGFGQSLPRCAGNHSQTQALYRFINNDSVNEQAIIDAEKARVQEVVHEAPAGQTYLAISDTTTLNYSASKSRDKLDCLTQANQKGFYTQSLLLNDAEGCPLGLLRQTFFNRPAQELGQSRAKGNSVESKKVPIEEKESYRWLEDLACLQTLFGSLSHQRFVLMGDREADMFELYAARKYEHIHVLTRLRFNRRSTPDGLKIKELLHETPCGGCMSLTFEDEKIKTKRTAHLEVRWVQILLPVPPMLKRHHASKHYKPLPLYAIEVFEPAPQEPGVVPLHWILLTSLPIHNFSQALEAIGFYAKRWRIEDFHLVLKEGCAVEKLQLEEPQALKNTIATLSIVAAQVLRLRYLNQTQGEQPMQICGVPPLAYTVVATYLKKARNIKKIDIPKQPTLTQFIQLLAHLGTGNPKNTGVRAIWRGYRDFVLIFEAFQVFNSS